MNDEPWINSSVGCPGIEGTVEVSMSEHGVFIGGDPAGLRSLARILEWLANVEQALVPTMPDGERSHIHLWPGQQVSTCSVNTEICRLDAKGAGELPDYYR